MDNIREFIDGVADTELKHYLEFRYIKKHEYKDTIAIKDVTGCMVTPNELRLSGIENTRCEGKRVNWSWKEDSIRDLIRFISVEDIKDYKRAGR
jgi:hypothetical protein